MNSSMAEGIGSANHMAAQRLRGRIAECAAESLSDRRSGGGHDDGSTGHEVGCLDDKNSRHDTRVCGKVEEKSAYNRVA